MVPPPVRLTIEWVVPLAETGPIHTALQGLMVAARAQPGCVGCSLTARMGERAGFCYEARAVSRNSVSWWSVPPSVPASNFTCRAGHAVLNTPRRSVGSRECKVGEEVRSGGSPVSHIRRSTVNWRQWVGRTTGPGSDSIRRLGATTPSRSDEIARGLGSPPVAQSAAIAAARLAMFTSASSAVAKHPPLIVERNRK
jgi:hypothetical protein